MADGSWFVLTTKPQGEFRADEELRAAGLQTMMPSYTRRISRNMRNTKREAVRFEPHMRRYICVAADSETVIWREAKAAKHVSKPLMAGQSIARLKEPEAARVEAMDETDPEARDGTPVHGFKVGQTVRIAEGPFIGLSGPIAYVGADVAKIELSLFGRITEIPAKFSIIEAHTG